MSTLRVCAPAKINWTLEVLGKRRDGYHEVRTVLQTIALSDRLRIAPADAVSLSMTGDAESLGREPIEANLAYRAAELLRERSGTRKGATITLDKRIPVAAGLGGGSSDAAATLRGLRRLWQLQASDEEMETLAAELGSDVPFFLRGGTALAEGRGNALTSLPEAPQQRLLIGWPPHRATADKTARMYAVLRAEHYTGGSRTERLADRVRRGEAARDEDIYNVFERVLSQVDPSLAGLLEEPPAAGAAHLCGSGPAVFVLLDAEQPIEPLRRQLETLGLRTAETRTLLAAEALAIEELP